MELYIFSLGKQTHLFTPLQNQNQTHELHALITQACVFPSQTDQKRQTHIPKKSFETDLIHSPNTIFHKSAVVCFSDLPTRAPERGKNGENEMPMPEKLNGVHKQKHVNKQFLCPGVMNHYKQPPFPRPLLHHNLTKTWLLASLCPSLILVKRIPRDFRLNKMTL